MSSGTNDIVAARLAAARARRATAGSGPGTGSPTQPGSQPPPASGPAILSSAQRRLWFLHQLEPDSVAYTVPTVWDLTGPLDVARLEQAWLTVIRRHAVLRTRIVSADGEPRPVLDDDPHPAWAVEPATDLEARTQAVLAEPFDLAEHQPWRARLLTSGPHQHRLVLALHHVAADGWSISVLLRELADGYAGAPLPELGWQYADVARHREIAARQPASQQATQRCLEHLRGAPETLGLPTDRPRPATADPAGGTVTLDLPPEQVAALRAVCQATGATPYAVLLGAVQTVLGRWAGTDDVVVGSPVAGRDLAEWEPLVGCFVNTVALRVTSDPEMTGRELVARARAATVHGLEHQQVPFEQVVEALTTGRDLSTTPVYQAMLIVHTEPEPVFALTGVQATWREVDLPVAKCDVTFHVWGRALDLTTDADELTLSLTYRTALWDEPTMRRLTGHLGAVLLHWAGSACAGLERPLRELSLLTPEEQAALPHHQGADVAAPAPAGPSLPAVVRAIAARHPDRPAVTAGDGSVTYGELLARADALGDRLHQEGVARGDRVGLLLDRSTDVVVAMLAVTSLGAAYVPLEPSYPDHRLRDLVAGAQLRLVVAHPGLGARLAPDTRWLALEQGRTTGPAALARPSRDTARPEDVAYVLFTSGTTGRPKGVEVEHRHLLVYLAGLAEVTGHEEGWSWAMVTTPSADLGLTNLFGALTSGGHVHLLSYEQVTDPEAVAAYFAAHRIDAMKLVPSHLRSWCTHVDPASVLPGRLLILAGEPCPWELVDLVRRTAPTLQIQSHYGPTETTVSTMAHPVPAGSRPETTVVPLGRPFPGTLAHVLDHVGQPAPVGVPGELVIAGPTVSRGYLGQPELTRQRFVEALGEHRAYRSGDQVRRLADGTLEFLGRVDDQVKIRGYRVEPAEIAAVIAEHPEVEEAVVVARYAQPGSTTLAGYLTPVAPRPAADLDLAGLREHLRARLPDHMVPVDLVPLDELPLTPNGKVDRAALPAPDPTRRGAGAAQRPLETPTELAIAESWRSVLGVTEIGATDSFFDLGGDSFSAVRAVRALDRGLSVVDLFTHPTVAELALHLDRDRSGPAEEGRSLLLRLDRGGTPSTHLVCVPYGGGSAVTFAPLAEHVGPGTAVYGVDLPGHDLGRPGEPTEALEEVAERLADELVELPGELVLYGHCLGGALAVRTALAVEARGRTLLGVVAGGTFPSARLPGRLARWVDKVIPSDRWLSDRAYHDMLRSLGGFTDVVDPQDRAFLVQALRHDSRESEGFYTRRFAGEAAGSGAGRLAAPLLCVVGQRDRATELYEERFSEWEEFAKDVELAVIPAAGHYFLKHQAGELATLLGDRVRAWRAGARPRSVSVVDAADRPRTSTFLWVALTQLMSMLGTGLTSFALGIWVLQETGSVTRFALISVMAVTPAILLSPVAGAVADRFDRRRVMLIADGIAGLATAGLVWLILSGGLELWYIYVYACVGSAANAFQRPAYLAAITQLVPKQYLGQANGLVTLGTSAADLLAALAGGILIGLFGLGWVVAVDVVTFLVATTVLLVVRFPDRLWHRREEGFWSEVAGGFRYIARRRPLVVMVIFFVVFNLLFAAPLVLVPSYVLATSNPQTVGVVLATGGLGALAGAVLMGLWGGTARRAVGMVGGTVTLGLGVTLTGLTPVAWVQCLGLFVVYGSLVVLNAHWLSLIQTKVGIELQGRVLAVNQMLAMSTMPIGFLTIGPATEWLAARFAAGDLPDLPAALGLPGDGGHLGAALVLLGVVTTVWGLLGLATRPLRLMEDALPDSIPDAVLTWDREELQRQADEELAAFAGAGAR